MNRFVHVCSPGSWVETARFVFSRLADDPDRPAPRPAPERIGEGDAAVMAEIVRRFSRRPD